MIQEELRNISIVVGGSIGMFLVLVGGFFLLCVASYALLWGMNWGFVQLNFPPPFGNENGPVGIEVILGAFLMLSLRRLTRIQRPED